VKLRAYFTQDTSCCFDETEYNKELTHQEETQLRMICDIINKKFERISAQFGGECIKDKIRDEVNRCLVNGESIKYDETVKHTSKQLQNIYLQMVAREYNDIHKQATADRLGFLQIHQYVTNKHTCFANVKLQTENLIIEILEEEFNTSVTRKKPQKQTNKPQQITTEMEKKENQQRTLNKESQEQLDAAVTDVEKRARQL
jgi:hypothetical protein